MADLGAFAADFASLRAVMAAGAANQPAVRWKLFTTAAAGAARCVSRGLSRADAADALLEIAHANGLTDEDAIQDIIAEAFEDVIAVVPLPLDEPPQANGKAHNARGNHARHRPAKEQITLVPFRDIVISRDVDYVVKGLIPRDGMTVIWGAPKCGKSFWTFDVFMHVAMGWEYRGHRVRQGPVVYLALEGGKGFNKRIVAWRNQHNIAQDIDVPFYLISVSIDLIKNTNDLITAIQEQLGPAVMPVAIIVDTLNRAMRGSENESGDMGKIIGAGDAIRETFNCAFAFIHHPGVSGDRMRGHTSLPGALDCEIFVSKTDETNISTAVVQNMRDGEPGARLAFQLHQIEVGRDEEDDPITTCTIHAVTDGAGAAGGRKPKPKSVRAFDLLREVVASYGQQLPQHVILQPSLTGQRDTLLGVEFGTWRSLCYAKMYEDKTNGTSAGQKQDTKKKAFQRVVQDLQSIELIDVSGDWVWITTKRDSGT